mgnify:CR=1 FL=1
MAKSPAAKTAQAKPKTNSAELIQKKLVLTGADIDEARARGGIACRRQEL